MSKSAEVNGLKVSPMLASALELADDAQLQAVLARAGYFYELKLDGVRIVADKRGDDVALVYRRGRSATASYPEIAEALRALPHERLVLDGEVIALDARGRPNFELLQRRIAQEKERDIKLAQREVPVVYIVFDVLSVDGRDLRDLPFSDRRQVLSSLIPDKGIVTTLECAKDDGRPLYELCVRQDLEGVVAKLGSSPYREGARSREWIKLKLVRDAEFVVYGYTHGERGRGPLGALDLASYDAEGVLRVRGKVGSGLTGRAIDALLARFAEMTVDRCPVLGDPERAPRGRVFVRPEIVVSVRYKGWSEDGRLLHTVFRGVRDDVTPEECVARP